MYHPTFSNNVKGLLPILLSMTDHGVVYCICVLVDERVECGIVVTRWYLNFCDHTVASLYSKLISLIFNINTT